MHLAGFIWTLFFWEYAVFFVEPSEASFDVFREDQFRLITCLGSYDYGSAYVFSSLLALTEDFVFPQHEILQEAQLKISKISTLEHPHLKKKFDEIIIYSMFEPFGSEADVDEFDPYHTFTSLHTDDNIVKVIIYSSLGVASSPSTMTEELRNGLALHFYEMSFFPNIVNQVLTELRAFKPNTRLIILNSPVADRTIALATAIKLRLVQDNLAAQWDHYSGGYRDPENFYWNLAQWYCYYLKVTLDRPQLVCDDWVDVPDNRRLSGSDSQELEPIKLGD